MNDKLDPQNDSHDLVHQTSDEMEHRGWPGDGSGEDDLADFNQMESADYVGE